MGNVAPKNLEAIYRITEEGKRRSRLDISKLDSLRNFVAEFKDVKLTVIVDNSSAEFASAVEATAGCKVIPTSVGNSGSFRLALESALGSTSDYFYFVEDDYWHLPGSCQILMEGLERFDYCTLYDHRDKYTLAAYDGLLSRLAFTDSSHWRTVPSTTMTFATCKSSLESDREIFLAALAGQVPQDHQMWLAINSEADRLWSALPGLSTHLELKWLSPIRDWTQYEK